VDNICDYGKNEATVVWTESNELANGNRWSDWQTERNTAKWNRDLESEDVYNPDTDRSIDVEEIYRVMKVFQENKEKDEAKLAE
jgi:hypothetical protein